MLIFVRLKLLQSLPGFVESFSAKVTSCAFT